MKQIPSHIKTDYEAYVKSKAISKGAHFHYLKWLRYYLDYCEKYCLEPLSKENVVPFIQKLKAKKQSAQQQKQAYHSVSLYYESMTANGRWVNTTHRNYRFKNPSVINL